MSSTVQDQLSQLEAIMALGTGQLDFSTVLDALAQQMSAGAATKTAAAAQILGDNTDKYIPVNPAYYRNLRELDKINHERRMQEIEYETARLKLQDLKAQSLIQS